MDVIEPVKRLAEKITGIGLPSREEAAACIIDRRPVRMKFRDDGSILTILNIQCFTIAG